MEILSENHYPAFEAFNQKHGSFTQSILWHKVKNNWQHEVVVSRENDNIIGAISLLILPNEGIIYAPRGPVCDLHNIDIILDLKHGINLVAKKYNAKILKLDPDTLFSDAQTIANFKALGFSHSYGCDGFEGIQARFNYRLYMSGRTEAEIFSQITPKTRYNIRVAAKHGVRVEIVDKNYLDDFYRLMEITGERDGFSIRPKEYFARMLDSLGEHVRLYMAFYEDKAVSAAITTNYARKVCYVYGASDNEFRNVMPNYFMQWEMIKWAVQTDCVLYDFQGVSGDMSKDSKMYGLYRFKKGFNGVLEELAGEFEFKYV